MKIYRQGDIAITGIEEIWDGVLSTERPLKFSVSSKYGSPLEYGMAIGHRLISVEPFEVYHVAGLGDMFFELYALGTLAHKNYDEIQIEPGRYAIFG